LNYSQIPSPPDEGDNYSNLSYGDKDLTKEQASLFHDISDFLFVNWRSIVSLNHVDCKWGIAPFLSIIRNAIKYADIKNVEDFDKFIRFIWGWNIV
jgi:hypothetical protein